MNRAQSKEGRVETQELLVSLILPLQQVPEIGPGLVEGGGQSVQRLVVVDETIKNAQVFVYNCAEGRYRQIASLLDEDGEMLLNGSVIDKPGSAVPLRGDVSKVMRYVAY